MKKTVLILICVCLFAGLAAQESEQRQIAPPKFKPRYAGSSVDAGVMFIPHYGSAFYVAPKLRFQATPRFFVNTGISIVQYNLMPSQMKYDSSPQRAVTGTYLFVEGAYLLNERWSVNGSVMKAVSPPPLQQKTTPYRRMPNEAIHFGVDYKISPNITVGARIGYTNGRTGGLYDPSYPY